MTGAVKDLAGSDPQVRERTRSLLLCLADNKRLLGIRYSDCMLGSPSLETGIAAASMAQDEWGHSRLTYALLSEFGDDPRRLEHEREPGEYFSMEALDEPLASYAALVAAAVAIDGALTTQYEALVGSRFSPVRNRVQKLLEEEVLHEHFAGGWASRLATSRLRDEFVQQLRAFIPAAARWFGPSDDSVDDLLRVEGIVRAGPEELRASYLRRIGTPLEHAGLAAAAGLARHGDGWQVEEELDWTGWDPHRRRAAPGGPDAESVARMRGDRNRVMLVE